MHDDAIEPAPTLASAIRCGRAWTKQSLRRLAKSSGVSPAQISRLEAGQVDKPSLETVMALAPALNFHPTILLVLSGHLQGESAREELARLFDSARVYLVAEFGEQEFSRLRTELESATTDEDLRALAVYAFTLTTAEVDWPADLASAMPTNAPDADLLRQVVETWRELTPDRRWRLVELARDMGEASRNEHNRQGKAPHDPPE